MEPLRVSIDRLPTTRASNELREPMNCKYCRKRKIKCNRIRPSCEACQIFGCSCIYDAVPKKRGPKTNNPKSLPGRVDDPKTDSKNDNLTDASINADAESSAQIPYCLTSSQPTPRANESLKYSTHMSSCLSSSADWRYTMPESCSSMAPMVYNPPCPSPHFDGDLSLAIGSQMNYNNLIPESADGSTLGIGAVPNQMFDLLQNHDTGQETAYVTGGPTSQLESTLSLLMSTRQSQGQVLQTGSAYPTSTREAGDVGENPFPMPLYQLGEYEQTRTGLSELHFFQNIG